MEFNPNLHQRQFSLSPEAHAQMQAAASDGQRHAEMHDHAQKTPVNDPRIHGVRYDASIRGHVVDVEPYRAHDRYSKSEVEVRSHYQNGPEPEWRSAYGHKIKKDGTPAARRQQVDVPTPDYVAETFDRADKARGQ